MKSRFGTRLVVSLGSFGVLACIGCGSSPAESQSEKSEKSASSDTEKPSGTKSNEPTENTQTPSASSDDDSSAGDDDGTSPSEEVTSTEDSSDSMDDASETGSEETDSEETGSETTGSEETGDKKPLGESCSDDGECESNHCNPGIMGMATCSECSDHDDCIESGAGISCALRGATIWKCEDGSISDHCSSEMNCKDEKVCGQVASILSTCSHCGEDKDCSDGKLCGIIPPTQSWPHLDCVEPASGKNGDMCRINQSGEEFCIQHCGVSGFDAEVGSCGECRDDDDCEANATCEPSSAGNNFMGSVCKAEDGETSGTDESGESDSTGDTDY